MRNKAIVYGFVGILSACFICGATEMVTLARAEDGGADSKEKDRLIGIFVTFDYLDLFDFESYLEDNAEKIVSGGEISMEESAAYNGRLYATLAEKEYVFEGVEGILYYEALIEDEAGSYYTSSGDEAISDGHLGITVTDAGDSIDMKGTIYMSVSGSEDCLYFNPVYQTADGLVYAMAGHGYSYSGEISEGMIGSVTLEEKNSYTIDGKTAEVGTKVEMSYAFMHPPVQIIVTQMDSGNQIVESQAYEPGEVPRELAPNANTEYIVVETVKQDEKGEEIHVREMYQKEDDSLETFYCREDGICVKKWTGLEWDD